MSARKWTWISSSKTVRYASWHHILFEYIILIGVMHTQVERVIAERVTKDSLGDVVPEYLIKWKGLSYAEATW